MKYSTGYLTAVIKEELQAACDLYEVKLLDKTHFKYCPPGFFIINLIVSEEDLDESRVRVAYKRHIAELAKHSALSLYKVSFEWQENKHLLITIVCENEALSQPTTGKPLSSSVEDVLAAKLSKHLVFVSQAGSSSPVHCFESSFTISHIPTSWTAIAIAIARAIANRFIEKTGSDDENISSFTLYKVSTSIVMENPAIDPVDDTIRSHLRTSVDSISVKATISYDRSWKGTDNV